jgi:acyl-CoA synthetase (AMP-forming)/AMP-acid ligase II
LVAEHRMPVVGAVAPQVALLLRVPDFDDHDLSCVQTIVVGGGASSPALVREAQERFGAAYSIRYSSTESGGLGTAVAPGAPDDEVLNTVGRPRPGTDIEIRDGARRVPDGETGAVCIRSGAVMSGYWNDPDATADTLRDGWLYTGDLGYIDGQGCLRLVGRSKEMFIRGGYNVFPMEVEAVLSAHPAVRDIAVVPRPDPVMGEIGVAVVVPRDPAAPPSLEALRAFATGQLATWKLPEDVRIVDSLPLTAVQKLDRRSLAAAEAASSLASQEQLDGQAPTGKDARP